MNGDVNNLAAGRLAFLILIFAFSVSLAWDRAYAAAGNNGLPDPAVDTPLATKKGKETAVLAGGCFWGVQAVFEHVKGVKEATSGYSGGSVASPQYEQVAPGKPGTPNQ